MRSRWRGWDVGWRCRSLQREHRSTCRLTWSSGTCPRSIAAPCAFDPADPLVALLADVLRQWPLSGVLSDLEDGPPVPPDLGGHEGLMMLYAERLVSHDRPGWLPEGRALEYVELVRGGRGRDQDRERPAEGVAGRWASW